MSSITFQAPWGGALKLMTTLLVGLLVGIALVGLANPAGVLWLLAMVALPLLILLTGMAFMIRGYELDGRLLRVQRLGWDSRLDLDELQSVEEDPGAMLGSIRVFGNGGLFCFAGRFRNRRLGAYRAFATDPKLAVVLRFRACTVVVTPGEPGRFVDEIRRRVGIAD